MLAADKQMRNSLDGTFSILNNNIRWTNSLITFWEGESKQQADVPLKWNYITVTLAFLVVSMNIHEHSSNEQSRAPDIFIFSSTQTNNGVLRAKLNLKQQPNRNVLHVLRLIVSQIKHLTQLKLFTQLCWPSFIAFHWCASSRTTLKNNAIVVQLCRKK